LPFYFSSAAVYSSNIVGSAASVSSFLQYQTFQTNSYADLKQIADVVSAYQWAANHELSYGHMLQAHALLSQHLLADKAYR
jgi:hypothetical protein